MVGFPLVVLHVDVVLIDILAHVDLGEDILELGVVMEGNRREWVEGVGINDLGLCHGFQLFSLGGLLLTSLVGLVGANIDSQSSWVDEEVGTNM